MSSALRATPQRTPACAPTRMPGPLPGKVPEHECETRALNARLKPMPACVPEPMPARPATPRNGEGPAMVAARCRNRHILIISYGNVLVIATYWLLATPRNGKGPAMTAARCRDPAAHAVVGAMTTVMTTVVATAVTNTVGMSALPRRQLSDCGRGAGTGGARGRRCHGVN